MFIKMTATTLVPCVTDDKNVGDKSPQKKSPLMGGLNFVKATALVRLF
jgi:hypothetical protein